MADLESTSPARYAMNVSRTDLMASLLKEMWNSLFIYYESLSRSQGPRAPEETQNQSHVINLIVVFHRNLYAALDEHM